MLKMDEKLYQTYREIEGTHWWFVGRRQLIFNLLESLDKDIRILDLGCNTGFLVNLLQQKGYEVYGCDSSEAAIAFGRQQGIRNLQVVEGNRLPFGDKEFDMILCLDVLEHLADDRQGLQEIKRVLKPGGLAIITVPAFNFLWGLQDKVSRHFRRYRASQIKKLAIQSGFNVKKLSYFNFFLFAPIALMRLAQKFYRSQRSSDFELNNRLTNAVLKRFFLLEIKILKYLNLPFGVSLIAVLEYEK